MAVYARMGVGGRVQVNELVFADVSEFRVKGDRH
jgi:hypothetical protein